MNIGARVASEDDVPMLVELYRTSQEHLVSERGGAVHALNEALSEPIEALFESIVHDDRWLVLLGTLDDVAVGVAVARLDEMSDATRLATVEVMFVDPPARSRGRGRSSRGDSRLGSSARRCGCRRPRAAGHEGFEKLPRRVRLRRPPLGHAPAVVVRTESGVPGELTSGRC